MSDFRHLAKKYGEINCSGVHHRLFRALVTVLFRRGINPLKCSGIRRWLFKIVRWHPGLIYIFNF